MADASSGDLTAPVVIVGAGPTGMSAAISLARHGVASTLLEQRAARSTHPKARGVRLRTMEILRTWGLSEQLNAVALPQDAQRFIYCDSVAGEELGRSPDVGDSESAVSPARSLRVPQNALESVLVQQVLDEPLIELRWDTTVEDLIQTEELVELRCRTTSTGQTLAPLTASYVIGADGGQSTVRTLLEVDVDGQPLIAYWQSIYWRGQIAAQVAGRRCIQFQTGARRGRSLSVAPVDGRDHWITMMPTSSQDHRPDVLDAVSAVDAVREAVGLPSLEVDVLDVAVWRVSATVAQTWKLGRVLLAGDAAHTFPPTGGFGLNAGIQDAHNLAWKLAYILVGRAAPELLDSYETERTPVAAEASAWSVANGARNREINAALADDDHARFEQLLDAQRDHVLALNQDLGYAYRSRAVQPSPPAPRPSEFVTAVELGRRAPHVWLQTEGSRVSVLDLFDSGFTLLVAPSDRGWTEVPITVPPIAVHVIGRGEATEPMDEVFDKLYELQRGAVLVRPDGHVAWRFDPAERPSGQALQAAVSKLLASRLATQVL